MSNIQNFTSKVQEFVQSNGYCGSIYAGEHLSGYKLREYFVRRNELYKIGIVPTDSPTLSYLLPRAVYDGMAWAYYYEWETSHLKDYYTFRKGYAQCLDLSYISIMNPGELSYPEDWILYKLFSKIEDLSSVFFENELCAEDLSDADLDLLLPPLHIIGMSIYYSWKDKTSVRLQFVSKLFNAASSIGFNQFNL